MLFEIVMSPRDRTVAFNHSDVGLNDGNGAVELGTVGPYTLAAPSVEIFPEIVLLEIVLSPSR